MIAILPAVQANCSRIRRYAAVSARTLRDVKRIANRYHRRFLNFHTHQMQLDPESFYDDPFNAPSRSAWDLC